MFLFILISKNIPDHLTVSIYGVSPPSIVLSQLSVAPSVYFAIFALSMPYIVEFGFYMSHGIVYVFAIPFAKFRDEF